MWNLTIQSRGNGYTGANFTSTPPPKLFDVSVLEPTQEIQGRARDQIQRYFNAFCRSSRRFRVELVGMRPFLGDLKIVEMSTGQELFIELKKGLADVAWNETSGSLVLKHLASDPQSDRKIFS